MAIEITGLCDASIEHNAPQTLATVVSACFSIYIGVALILASMQLYTVSKHAHMGDPSTKRFDQRRARVRSPSVAPMAATASTAPTADPREVSAAFAITGAMRRRAFARERSEETAIAAARAVLPQMSCAPLLTMKT